MKIESIDFFYLSMPKVLDIGDGSQDALLVRLQAGGYVGWGECEAAPLVSIASLICPMSHSACKPVQDSVLGQRLESADDIARIGNLVRQNSLDLLQTDHTLSGIDIAMWDLLGQKLQTPVYQLLGYQCSYPKTPYASVLFGNTPEQTLQKGRQIRQQGYLAGKFGWGNFGHGTVASDVEQIHAAREGLGTDGILLIDAGTVWVDDIEPAKLRVDALKDCRVTWLEEPFISGGFNSYHQLAKLSYPVLLAGGEGAHNYHLAQHMIDYANIGFVQIDAGRIGGISVAKKVADYALSKGTIYVNHTFTSHLALSASLQPYAGIEHYDLCEYPVEPQPLGTEMTHDHLLPDDNGKICLSDKPGLGISPDLEAIASYLIDVEITISGKRLYRTPVL